MYLLIIINISEKQRNVVPKTKTKNHLENNISNVFE